MADLIEVTGLSKRFGGIVALSDARLSARAGEVHALLGENGAGKSTLIQILAGAIRHDTGTILLDNAPYRPASPDAARAAGIAAVFQELSLVPDLTRRAEHLVPPRAPHPPRAPPTAAPSAAPPRSSSPATASPTSAPTARSAA